jgi:hypothetical protein
MLMHKPPVIFRFPVPVVALHLAISLILPQYHIYQLTAPIIQNTPNRGQCYTTPPGYKPAGPVYIFSPDNTGVEFFARMW